MIGRKLRPQPHPHCSSAMEALIPWLLANIPKESTPCVVHGDFRLDNIIFKEDAPECLAVLDWEFVSSPNPPAPCPPPHPPPPHRAHFSRNTSPSSLIFFSSSAFKCLRVRVLVAVV